MILVRIALEFMTLDLSFLLDTPRPLDGWELLSAALNIAVFATKDQHLDSALLDSFREGAQGDRSSFHFRLNPNRICLSSLQSVVSCIGLRSCCFYDFGRCCVSIQRWRSSSLSKLFS